MGEIVAAAIVASNQLGLRTDAHRDESSDRPNPR